MLPREIADFAREAVEPIRARKQRRAAEDELLDHNRRFITAAEARGVELASRLRPGAHTWDFWDESIQDVLDWLPLQDR